MPVICVILAPMTRSNSLHNGFLPKGTVLTTSQFHVSAAFFELAQAFKWQMVIILDFPSSQVRNKNENQSLLTGTWKKCFTVPSKIIFTCIIKFTCHLNVFFFLLNCRICSMFLSTTTHFFFPIVTKIHEPFSNVKSEWILLDWRDTYTNTLAVIYPISH